jgi:DnaJ-domain-containing protein 1
MDEAHEAARALALARWGNQAVVRAAQVVLERADELDPVMRAQVHLATADEEDSDD